MKRIFKHLGQPLILSLRALLAPAEDPRVVFCDQLQGLRVLLREVRQTAAMAVVLQKQLKDRARNVREKLPQLDDEARQALVAGRDDLARAIVQRRQLAALEGQRLEGQVNGLEHEDQRLELLAQRLLTQIESLSTRQNVDAAQSSAAETRMRIAEALASVSKKLGDLGVDAKRAEQKTEQLHAHATTDDDLTAQEVSSQSGRSAPADQARQNDQPEFEQMVDERIALLKRQLTQSKSAGGK
jgi:phage shock protein A